MTTRRNWLKTTAGITLGLKFGSEVMADDKPTEFKCHQWEKDAKNPILRPGETYDLGCCMNPFVLRRGDEYYLYYAGAENKGRRRICLAIAPVDNIHAWKKLGPLFETGDKGAFDETWCVLPCVHRVGDKWHMYYTGRSSLNQGLQSFWGMGLAVSDDLLNWKKTSPEPIMTGDGFSEFPKNRGIAGGARILEMPQPDGRILYRMHYTLPTGTSSKNLLIDQAKHAVCAESYDGLKWTNKRILLQPRLDADYENAATIALNVWKTKTRWRAIYAGIGTRFGSYSICEAVSNDGLVWQRGKPGENLALPPTGGNGWESKMTTYPNVIEENGKLRLFYCGNGYGATGVGTAVAEMLD